MCAVGELLHKDLSEVRELPLSELYTWISWLAYKNEQEEKAIKSAKAKQGSAPKPARAMGKGRR